MPFDYFDAPVYRDIDKMFLLTDNLEIDFDVFTRTTSKENDPPVLLFGSTTPTETIKHALNTKKHGKLCIREEDRHKFLDFVGDSLEKTIEDDNVSLEKKSSLVYSCAKDSMIAVFDDPRSGENIKRTRKVTNTILKFALGDPLSIPSLLNLGSHDYYTFTHCVNVAVFSVGLAVMIGTGTESELEDFAHGCILHDIGKSQIDNSIINKPGKLTDEEFEIIKNHPQYGYELMKNSVSDTSLDVILHHHERYDGSGYPHGLKGDNISDYAKIAVIADVYDALTTNRSYARARDPYQATLLMKEEMAGHFEHKKFLKFVHFIWGNNQ